MRSYIIFSTISYVFITAIIELLMATNPGFSTYFGFNWLLTADMWTTSHILLWSLQGLVLSFTAFVFIDSKSSLEGGLRFGLITGLLYVMVILFNMLIHVDHSYYSFFEQSLLPLVGLQLLGFAVTGWIFGLMYELFAPKFPNAKTLWSLA